MRGVRSNSACGVAERGADGPARRSSSLSRAWRTEPPPIHSPQTAAGHDRMTRSSRRSSPQGTACGFRIRAWGQREPADQGTGRLSDRTRCRFAQGWAGHPCHSRRMQLTSHRTPDPDVDAPRLVRRWSNRNLCLSSDNCLLEWRSPPRDASAGRSRPLPGCCPHQRGCPIPGRVDSW